MAAALADADGAGSRGRRIDLAAGPIVDRVIRGIPVWLLRAYLVELGARRGRKGVLRGDGWAAAVERAEDFQLGSLRVGQARLRLYGAADVVGSVVPALEKKLLRGGG